MLTHTFISEVNISLYPELHKLIHSAESKERTLLHEIIKNRDDDKLYITIPEKNISLDGFYVINSTKPPKSVEPEV